jgi:hypothetical protein
MKEEQLKINEQLPIRKGEIFEPEKEIRKVLKAPKTERPAKLAKFKEKLAFQKAGLAKTQKESIEKIRENPEASFKELFEEVCRLGEEYGMNEEQKKVAYSALEKYELCHRAVQDEYESYSDGSEIYRDLFGKEPKGEIEILVGPVLLYIKCYDQEDYERLYWRGEQEKNSRLPFNNEIKEKANKSKGVQIALASHPDLRIAAENVTQVVKEPDPEEYSKSVFPHEEEHVIYGFFEEPFEADRTFANRAAKDFKEAKEQKEKERILRTYFRKTREEAETYAKDETLAYYKDGTGFSEIVKKIFEEFDFLKKKKESKFRPLWMSESEETTAMSEKIEHEIYFEEYENVLSEATNAIKKMEDAGYEKEEIIALLTHEPLAKWGKVVEKVLENT